MFHRPFVDSLIYGLLAVSFPFLFLMLWGAKVEQERRARAQQQPSNLDPGARIVGDAPGANSAVTPAGMPTPARSPIWRLIVLAASLALNMAFFVLHDPFEKGSAIGIGICGGGLLTRLLARPEPPRQNTAE